MGQHDEAVTIGDPIKIDCALTPLVSGWLVDHWPARAKAGGVGGSRVRPVFRARWCTIALVTDWRSWHGQYEDPNSSLSRRLRVVQRRLDELLSDAAAPRRVLSLCAGDGRDIIPVLAREPVERRPDVVLVEMDPALGAAADQRAADAGVAVTVIVGDAGALDTWQSVTPVDLLLLCGIFGNVTEDDIRTTIAAARAVLTPGGRVIWTRGYFSDRDLRPQIRAWFAEAGFREIAFDSEPTGYGVGVNQLAANVGAERPPPRLFSFVR